MSNLWGPGAWEKEADRVDVDIAATKANKAAHSGSLAAAGKAKKKNKGQTLTLAEFATGAFVGLGGRNHIGGAPVASTSNGLTTGGLLMLPRGPRDRSGDEADYGGGGSFREESDGQRGSDKKPHTRANDFEPSRADQVENWASAKKVASPPPGSERRPQSRANDLEPSRADKVENWAAAKKVAPAPPASSYNGSNRQRYDAGGQASRYDPNGLQRSRADEVNNWGAGKRTRSFGSMGTEGWGNGRGEGFSSAVERDRERPRLVLNPPSRPGNDALHVSDAAKLPLSDASQVDAAKPRQKPNPFGSARPREEVLSKRGEDSKKLESEIESRSTNRLASSQWKKSESEIESRSSSRPTSSECSRPQ